MAIAGVKTIAICQLGGEFHTDHDGSLSYSGGDAHAIDIDDQLQFADFKMEVAEMFNCGGGGINSMSLKYFLPGNLKTLITISNDKDFHRMLRFHCNSLTIDVYVFLDQDPLPDFSSFPASRSSRTTLSEAQVLPPEALDIVDTEADAEEVEDAHHHRDITLANIVVDDTASVINVEFDLPHQEISPVLPLMAASTSSIDQKHAKAAEQWNDTITGVGQRFSCVTEFRESLRKYAIAHQFAFKYKKNDSHRVTVKCKADGCPWRIHASRLSNTQLICIKKMHPTHTCDGSALTTGHQATRSWVASIIKEKLKVFPNYKPKDIVNDIKQEYGIQLNYFQAWRGKEIAREQLQGSFKDAYNLLPLLCDQIVETNPGSLATFTTKDDSSFQRLFVAFNASLAGFLQGCRPLLFLDSISLKSKYQGALLAATAADGNDEVFPVAFAVVDTETDDNWHWFLLQLKTALPTSCPLTFVSDRQKGLKESIAEIFQDSYHGYCLRYLTEQLFRELKGQFSHEVKRLIVEDIYSAAYAPRSDAFHQYTESIKSISVEVYNWIIQSEHQNWANSFFQGARYNHMTSNFGELFYSWISDAHELPITQMVDVIRGKIEELVYARRTNSDQWLTKLTPSMEEKLEQESLHVSSLQVLLSAGSTFEVRGESSVEIVDIDHWDCSCKGWQLTGLPCCHAMAVIGCIGRNPYDYCSRYFTTECYGLTYSETVHPIPQSAERKSTSGSVTITPPPTRRPPGRPTTKKYAAQEIMKRQLQCSRCKGLGHNKSTCKEML
ncbi:hypothetical protein LINGRAHAP2_LOCUS13165 [Linum grandiflorum]